MEKVISDPNFSLIQLPIEFKARKHAGRASFKKPGSYELFNADGPGCIRHMTAIYKPFGDHTRIEIFSDDNDKPQVDMNLNAFFGVLLPAGPLSDVLSNRSDNRIAGSSRGLLPNRLATIRGWYRADTVPIACTAPQGDPRSSIFWRHLPDCRDRWTWFRGGAVQGHPSARYERSALSHDSLDTH